MIVATAHKEAAVAFLRLSSSGKVREAFETYTAATFRHHNPFFRGDATSLAAGMADNAEQFPNKLLDVQRTIEEGDLVAVHSRVRLAPDKPAIAVVHIFRFEGDRVVELWDIGQPAPDDSPNEYGMF